MTVENSSALLIQWFYHKHKVLPKGNESSWQNYISYAARNATTKRTFIVTEKTFMDIRNTSVRNVGISLHQIPRSAVPAGRVNVHPRLPRCVRKRCFFITTRNAITPFLYPNQPWSLPHPCPNCLERRISSGCGILSM